QEVTGVSLRDSRQNGPTGSEVLVGLARDDPGPYAVREAVHGQKEEIRRANQRHRLEVGEVAVRLDDLEVDRVPVCGGERTRQVHLEPLRELGPAPEYGPDGLEEVDMRARKDV